MNGNGSHVGCANPTCMVKVPVHPATLRAIELGREDTLQRFAQSKGWTVELEDGLPRLYCERCSL